MEEEKESKELFDYGIIYSFGLGNKDGLNELKAFEYFNKSFSFGYGPSAIFLARLLEYGLGVTKNRQQAEKFCIEGLNQIKDKKEKKSVSLSEEEYNNNHNNNNNTDDNVVSLLVNGYSSSWGYGVEQNDLISFENFMKAATKYNSSIAQNCLGYLFLVGKGVNQNIQEAVKWYQKAAEQNDCLAQFQLGWMYSENQIGLEKNIYKAIEWYTRAANQKELTAQYNLGHLYLEGGENGNNIVEPDTTKAIKWFTIAAEYNDIDAQYELGKIYTRGIGVERDLEQGIKWFVRAAEQNDRESQYHLGYIYIHGEAQTIEEEEYEYENEYEDEEENEQQNEQPIQHQEQINEDEDEEQDEEQEQQQQQEQNVMNIITTPQTNFQEGVKWYLKAAENNHILAQYEIGMIYFSGNKSGRLQKDEITALKIFYSCITSLSIN